MATHTDPLPSTNTEYDPGANDGHAELVLNVMKTDPYPSVTPYRVVQRVDPDPDSDDFNKFDAHHALNSLVDAGWVHHRERGLYDLITDPRGDVPAWPVDWNDVGSLPDPLPNQPENLDRVRAIHARHI